MVTLANGVDIERFQPSAVEPEPDRLLFIGSFAHLPNLLAIDFFLREVWPLARVAPSASAHHCGVDNIASITNGFGIGSGFRWTRPG